MCFNEKKWGLKGIEWETGEWTVKRYLSRGIVCFLILLAHERACNCTTTFLINRSEWDEEKPTDSGEGSRLPKKGAHPTTKKWGPGQGPSGWVIDLGAEDVVVMIQASFDFLARLRLFLPWSFVLQLNLLRFHLHAHLFRRFTLFIQATRPIIQLMHYVLRG